MRRFALILLLTLAGGFALAETPNDKNAEDAQALKAQMMEAEGAVPPPEVLRLNPVEGAWAKYRLTDFKTQTTREILIGVPDVNERPDGTEVWIEIQTKSAKGTSVILKVLYTTGMDGKGLVRRLVVKSGEHPAVELVDLPPVPKETPEPPGKYFLVDQEEIDVPAGTFDAEHSRFESTRGEVRELWFSESVPPFSLIRNLSSTSELELVGYGRDYMEKISETPVRLKGEKPPKPKAAK